MPRNQKEMNEQIKEERRQLILLTALKTFTRKGFAASKMTDISTAANISYGLLYYYFKSKEEIYLELIKHAASSSADLIKTIANDGNSRPIDKIHLLVTKILEGIRNKDAAAYYFVLCIEALTSDSNPKAVAQIVKEIMRPLTILADVILDGQKSKQIKQGDPMDMAIASFSMILGLSSLMISGKIKHLPSSEIIYRIFENS